MVLGHGIIDYIVVAFGMLLAWRLLQKEPQKLLLWLPLMMTVDFFIPIVSHLTLGRLVPLLIIAWWVISGKFILHGRMKTWFGVAAFTVVMSIGISFILGGFETRYLIRSLYYVGLITVAGFCWQAARGKKGIRYFWQGLALAGAVHGGHAVYQVLANRLGLPYRGIVYSEFGVGGGGGAHGAFRINGFADEPKRLGFVLLAAVIAWFVIALRKKSGRERLVCFIVATFLLFLSLYTFSASYIVSLVIWAPFVLLLYPKGLKYGVSLLGIGAVGLAIGAGTGVIDVTAYYKAQVELLENRQLEVEQGLDSKHIYRQEFYAEDYLKNSSHNGILGVGMGRYYEVLHKRYGYGVGRGSDGTLYPLNSQPLEILFDLGLLGIGIVYVMSLGLILFLKKCGQLGKIYASLTLFLIIQSLFVQSLPLLAIVCGAGAGYLMYFSKLRAVTRERRMVVISKTVSEAQAEV